jgi:hypothetical protein
MGEELEATKQREPIMFELSIQESNGIIDMKISHHFLFQTFLVFPVRIQILSSFNLMSFIKAMIIPLMPISLNCS